MEKEGETNSLKNMKIKIYEKKERQKERKNERKKENERNELTSNEEKYVV